MTSQGSAHGRFARAVKNRNLLNAEIAARELGELSLADALAFCLLLADVDPPRFQRAIARWTARLILEARSITADEAVLALSAAKGLAGLRTREIAQHPTQAEACPTVDPSTTLKRGVDGPRV